MKVVALVSGGKDSTLNMLKCLQYGHQIICIANLRPSEGEDELDSFCFQSVGQHSVSLYGQCMGIPVYFREMQRDSSVNQNLRYTETVGDEIEVFFRCCTRSCPGIQILQR